MQIDESIIKSHLIFYRFIRFSCYTELKYKYLMSDRRLITKHPHKTSLIYKSIIIL